MEERPKIGVVNVGTIGHIDHGGHCTASIIARLQDAGYDAIFLSEEDVLKATGEGFPYQQVLMDEVEPYAGYGKKVRKLEKKDRFRELQRKAFKGER